MSDIKGELDYQFIVNFCGCLFDRGDDRCSANRHWPT